MPSSAEYGEQFPPPPRDQLESTSDDRRSAVLIDYLLARLDGRTLLVVVENLDDVMRGLKHEGQKRWRAFLQEHPVAATLATSQQLTEDLSDRAQPFFGFFQIEHLQPLLADDALLLLQKIAAHNENTDLAAFLQTPTGRARVRAIRHIAGGSHRVFIILSEFATREKLDDLVTAFEELLDELTPYYQERLRWLPDQQREIVEFLCRQVQTVRVKEIANELFLSEQTAGAQLKSLKDKGYVIAGSVGRESRYELAEPLMRMCVEVKDPQREPIRLIVEFLRIWYDRERVETMLGRLPMEAEMHRRYFTAALQAHQSEVPNPVMVALERDLEAARVSGNTNEEVRVLVEVAATADDFVSCLVAAMELAGCGQYKETLLACDRAIELDSTDSYSWYFRGRAKLALGQIFGAIADFRHALSTESANASIFDSLAEALVLQGNWDEAEQILSERFRLPRSLMNPVGSYYLPNLLVAIFRASEPQVWTHQVGRLVTLAGAAQEGSEPAARPYPLAILGNALVRTLTNKAYMEAPPERFDAWEGVWLKLAHRMMNSEPHPELTLAVRLFLVGKQYLQTRDEKSLLDLVQEERAILRDLFDLDRREDSLAPHYRDA